MPIVTAAFAHAMASAAGLSLTADGRVLSAETVVHRLAVLPDGSVEDQSFFDLIDWIERRHPDRVALIANYAETICLDNLGVLGLVLKTAPTLGVSLARFARYFRSLTDTAIYRLDQSGELPLLVIEARTEDHPALTLRNECALAAVVRKMRGFVRGRVELEYVTFRHHCTGDPARYAELFGCPVIFGAAMDAAAMTPQSLALPNRLGDAAVSDFLTRHLDGALGEAPAQPSLRDDLARRLSQTLSTGVPSAATLAEDMGMSERTFFRRLAEEGTSLREVLREVQITLARELLERGECSIAEVAFLTGFAEQSTFGRAFKRWVGQTPAQFRTGRPDMSDAAFVPVTAGLAQTMAGPANTMQAGMV